MKVFGVAGYKNAGKTGLMERLVAEITGRGYSVSTLKHAHHRFDLDQPGKDSYRHRMAGAHQVVLGSSARWATMTELRGAPEPPLVALLDRLDPVDLVLVEGWKRGPHPKIEAHRGETGHPLIAPGDASVLAVASDRPLTLDRPVFDLNDTRAIADFVLARTGLPARAPGPSHWDSFVVVDWSGGNGKSATPQKDAIWAAVVRDGVPAPARYFRNRQVVTTWLTDLIAAELAAGRRCLIGFDFPFGYPAGFSRHLTGSDHPLDLWAHLAQRITDSPESNNRFEVAGQINGTLPGTGPFWGNADPKTDVPHLPRKGTARTPAPFPERRQVETLAKGAFTCWQLAGAGAVGSQILTGLPVLHHLRETYRDQVAVWPFQPLAAPVALVEVWPSLFAGPAPEGIIKDAHQVERTAAHLAGMTPVELGGLLEVDAPEEGWILGVPFPHKTP